MTIEAVPTLEDAIPALQEPSAFERKRDSVGLPPSRVGRRGFLKAIGAAGLGLGFASLGVFPSARPAAAHCTTTLETKMYGSCPSSSSGFGCSPACGPSTVYWDVCGSGGWHKTTGNYRMRPNHCKSGGYDGWYWGKSPCEECGGYTYFKCHDGCKKIGALWYNSICRTYVC